MFRSPVMIRKLDEYLVECVTKRKVLRSFATGFESRFEYPPPKRWGHVVNYNPLREENGIKTLRSCMKKQVLAGKVIGGPGWTTHRVHQFFGD